MAQSTLHSKAEISEIPGIPDKPEIPDKAEITEFSAISGISLITDLLSISDNLSPSTVPVRSRHALADSRTRTAVDWYRNCLLDFGIPRAV
jgi:hypothetical protein